MAVRHRAAACTPSERSFDADRAEREDSESGENGGFHENGGQYEDRSGPMEDKGACIADKAVVCWHEDAL